MRANGAPLLASEFHFAPPPFLRSRAVVARKIFGLVLSQNGGGGAGASADRRRPEGQRNSFSFFFAPPPLISLEFPSPRFIRLPSLYRDV